MANGDVGAVSDLSARARRAGLRVAVAESLTSGAIAGRLGAGEAAAEWFAGGLVAYQTRTKVEVLGLGPDTDPCSAECAERMATRTRELIDADVSVSATGVGGPGPENGHAPGTVYLGWATRGAAGSRLYRFAGDPEEVLRATCDAALDLLLGLVP